MGKSKPAPVRMDARRWTEKYFVAVLAIILAGSALIYILRNPQYRTGSFNDDAISVIGARDFWQPAAQRSPLLKPDYPPPGLPLLLSPFAFFITSDWTALELITIVFTILLVYVMALWARRWLSAGETLAATALLAFNPVIARLSGSVMAGIYYTVAIVASLYLYSRWQERPSKGKALALGFVLGWGSLARPEGALLLIGLVIPAALKRQTRPILAWMAIPLAAWGAFAWYWFRIRTFPHSEYAGDLAALTTYWSANFASGIHFTVALLTDFINNTLLSSKLVRSLSPAVNHGLIVVCIGVAAAGFISLWNHKKREHDGMIAAAAFCVLYLAVHIFWHADAARYAIPLLPFLMVFGVRGLRMLTRRIPHQMRLLQLFLAAALIFDVYRNALALHTYYTRPNLRNGPPWRTLTWIRANIPADALVMSNIAPSIDLYTRRLSSNGIYSDNMEWLDYQLITGHYVFLVLRAGDFLTPGVGDTQDPNKLWNRVKGWAAAYPRRFVLLYKDAAEETFVYRIVDDANYVRAYELFKQAVPLYSRDPSDRDGRAMRLLNAALVIDPRLGSAYNFLGGIYLNRQNGPAAGQAFLKAVDCLPDDPYAMMNLATMYRMAGQPDKAQAYAQRVLDIGAANGDAAFWSASVQQMHRDWDVKRLRLYLDAPMTQDIPPATEDPRAVSP